ncbi:MAG: hypothetical protein PHN38_05800 [Sulfurospirillaceae bacterium]|nr:hypothetical protein [Sulfurospirillaceae bacterium]MDD3462938.1 hypothetical protein [Sulfurospirillaceae bacterium]
MSTLTQRERQALNEVFVSLKERERFFLRLHESAKDIKIFIKSFLKSKRKHKNHI